MRQSSVEWVHYKPGVSLVQIGENETECNAISGLRHSSIQLVEWDIVQYN